MSNIINNREEILFMFDASYCNPNGDPADENKPRMDPETQINLVSDVRLKRTIRDYLREVKGLEIFVYAPPDESGVIPDGKTRALEFKEDIKKITTKTKAILDNNILTRCIDIRLFGSTIPIKLEDVKQDAVIVHTGPVQFKIGQSFHRVGVERLKGTGAFASEKEKKKKFNKSFRTEFIVPYSFISHYGIVNEYRAKEVSLTENDLEEMYEAMWNGIRHLTTRSKTGQNPRFLMVIRYREGNFQISELDRKVELKSVLDDLQLRSVKDFTLNVDDLMTTIVKAKDRIEKIRLQIDEDLRFSIEDQVIDGEGFKAELEKKGITVETFDFW